MEGGKPPPAGDLFIVYTHPSQRNDKNNKHKVATYVGKHFRNRSRPAQKQAPVGGASLQSLNPSSHPVHRQSNFHVRWRHRHATQLPRDTHGLRADPFLSYPTTTPSSPLSEAVDFFLHAYGPTHLLRKGVDLTPNGTSIVNPYFRYSMQHPVMFEALLASTFSNMRIHSWLDRQPDKQTIGHYGEALSKLRDSLAQQNAYIEDAVVFSILSLLEVEYLMGNMSAYQVHVRGLKRIVDLRGGLDSLGWVGLLKPAVTGVLAFWYSINQPWAGDPFEFDRGQYLVPLTPSVLPPGLGSAAVMAYLDIGTKQLVEEGRLSPHVVSHVQQVYYNWKDVDLYTFSPFGGKSAANVEGRERGWSLMAYAGNSLVDRIVLTAMQHTLLDVSHAERFSEYYGRLIFNWVGFCSSAIDEVDEGDTALCDLLIWLCMKLVGGLTATFLRVQSSSKDDQRFQLMTKVLATYPKTQDWKRLESIVKKFKWSEHCLHFWHLSWQIVTSSSLTEPELRLG